MTGERQAGGWRWRRAGAVALALLAGVALALLLVWTQRRGLADDFIARELARRGVTARYTIDAIGLSRQRISNVVIGDPAAPDAVADWIEVDTSLGLFSGARVTGVRIGRGWVHARLIDGRVSLGAIDALLPEPSGKPFAFPELDARIGDLRVRLDTPNGMVGLKLAGAGGLNDGFSGTLAAVAPSLELGECTADALRIVGAVRIARGAPAITGPARLAALDCGGMTAEGLRADLDLALGAALDSWRGDARLAAVRAGGEGIRTAGIDGRLTFAGSAAATQGTLDLAAAQVAGAGATAAGLRLRGRYGIGPRIRFDGQVAADRASASDAMLRQLASLRTTGAGTPVGPLADKLSRALVAAGRAARIEADISVQAGQDRGAVVANRLALDAASGAALRLEGAPAIAWRWPARGGLLLNGTATIGGGGLPEGRIELAQATPGAPVTGRATFRPYEAGAARLALAPVEFRAGAGGGTRIATRMTLSGPLGDGAVERLAVPLEAAWDGAGRIVVNRGCVPARFDALRISSLTLDAAAVRLCPLGEALVSIAGTRVRGGARIANPRLAGRIGGTPLTLAAADARYALGDGGFTLRDVAARIGEAAAPTRLDVALLNGRVAGGAIGGSFEGAAGQIGQVPLLLSEGAGDWRLAGGELVLEGGVRVADADAAPRFNPMVSDDVVLTLIDGVIAATGSLHLPDDPTRVADVTIRHDLGAGAGRAVLDVDGLAFAPGGFQPDALTRLTFGVIADVRGSVSGAGTIAWDAEGVTSTGTFRTENTNLAAAFGPVTGLSTTIRFGDLLGLATPDGEVQTATVALLNPGIPVENGVIRYRLLGAQRIAVEEGRWPFAGGELILEPTVLDFGQSGVARRMTFRVVGADAAKFLQEMDFDNVDATGVFDGELPMIFDARGGRIEGGELHARDGGTIAYVGELTQEDLGFWGNYAFQALKSLQYRELDLTMNGPLDGEMITRIRFAGIRQGADAKTDFITRRLARLPIVFNLTIRAPFRQLADSVSGWYDPSRLVERNLPQLLEEQREAEKAPDDDSIQPEESETVP